MIVGEGKGCRAMGMQLLEALNAGGDAMAKRAKSEAEVFG
jgi:hypothetical protein